MLYINGMNEVLYIQIITTYDKSEKYQVKVIISKTIYQSFNRKIIKNYTI